MPGRRPPWSVPCILALTLLTAARAAAADTRPRTLVGLRGQDDAALERLLAAQQDPASPHYRQWLTPEEFGRRFGAAPRDLRRVERWLRDSGCRVRRSTGRQQVECVGGHPAAPAAPVAPLIEDVLDLDTPLALARKIDVSAIRPQSQDSSGNFLFTPEEYAGFYGFTSLRAAGITGAGERIGIVGTARVDASDIALFRTRFGLPPLDLEQVGTPAAYLEEEDFLESLLDVSWSGAVAPGAAVVLSITGGTVVDGIRYLVNRADVSVISLSVAPIPSKRTRPFIRQSLRLFRQAASQGQSVLIASGDFGPLIVLRPTPKRGVDPLAQSPFVTGVGGTTPASTSLAGAFTYESEVVWQDGRYASGGGRSSRKRPAWQSGLGNRTRTVPDVSLAASSVYPIPWDGTIICCVGGTSAAAPAWAGLTAMLNQQKGRRVGLLNPTLYALGNAQAGGGAAVFHDIVDGSSTTTQARGFPAKPGYDLATGWGTPSVPALFAAFP